MGSMDSSVIWVILGFLVWMGIVIKPGLCLENVALKKPASMSPFGDTVFLDASEAVDGRSSTANHPNGVCVHTVSGDPKPWVIIDLLQEHYIHYIYLINRLDCCKSNLHDFIIDVFKTNPARCASANGTVCKKYIGVFGTTGQVMCDTPVVGRFVRIWKPINNDNNDVLNFCEMEVYGEAKDPECGPAFIPVSSVSGKRLFSTNMTSFSVSSKLACVVDCEMSGACVSGNYNTWNGVCELLTRPEYNDATYTDTAWVYFGQDLC